eukprot:m.463736 g.463736  ORF g.463736 m.463736 type:complete len:221 (-) comp21611_c0_seq24:2633-3295(-)
MSASHDCGFVHSTTSRGIHIISWNVAGWIKTLQYIEKHHGSLKDWLDAHNVDILALQEVKTTSKRLESEPAIHGCRCPGFETFWSCCDGSTATPGNAADVKKNKGFNGVATFVRKSVMPKCTPTVLANAAVLEVPELDSEGRCLVTDHGSFVVFNVYVPNSGMGSRRLPYKLKFLRRLREKMSEVRRGGKQVFSPVVLSSPSTVHKRRRTESGDWAHVLS